MNNNFNEQFLEEMVSAGIEHGKIVSIPEEMKGTPEDYFELARKIALTTKENDNRPLITDFLPLGD